MITANSEPMLIKQGLGSGTRQQERITRSLQLPYYAFVTEFLQTGLFLGIFSWEIGQFRSAWARIGREDNGGHVDKMKIEQ